MYCLEFFMFTILRLISLICPYLADIFEIKNPNKKTPFSVAIVEIQHIGLRYQENLPIHIHESIIYINSCILNGTFFDSKVGEIWFGFCHLDLKDYTLCLKKFGHE